MPQNGILVFSFSFLLFLIFLAIESFFLEGKSFSGEQLLLIKVGKVFIAFSLSLIPALLYYVGNNSQRASFSFFHNLIQNWGDDLYEKEIKNFKASEPFKSLIYLFKKRYLEEKEKQDKVIREILFTHKEISEFYKPLQLTRNISLPGFNYYSNHLHHFESGKNASWLLPVQDGCIGILLHAQLEKELSLAVLSRIDGYFSCARIHNQLSAEDILRGFTICLKEFQNYQFLLSCVFVSSDNNLWFINYQKNPIFVLGENSYEALSMEEEYYSQEMPEPHYKRTSLRNGEKLILLPDSLCQDLYMDINLLQTYLMKARKDCITKDGFEFAQIFFQILDERAKEKNIPFQNEKQIIVVGSYS
ncbi:MAG: hypothetical protein H7A25_02925 [Leptospiraceae bacterium]|nr:hypothetical protein [Leptospiraceae bacterium]